MNSLGDVSQGRLAPACPASQALGSWREPASGFWRWGLRRVGGGGPGGLAKSRRDGMFIARAEPNLSKPQRGDMDRNWRTPAHACRSVGKRLEAVLGSERGRGCPLPGRGSLGTLMLFDYAVHQGRETNRQHDINARVEDRPHERLRKAQPKDKTENDQCNP